MARFDTGGQLNVCAHTGSAFELHQSGCHSRPMGDRQARTEAAYDTIAAEYASVAANRSSEAAAFFGRFTARLGSRALIADLGCGPGADLRRLEDAGLRAVGLDRSAGLLRLAHLSPRTRADLAALPFRAGSLDGIWSHASLLHVDASELPRTFVEWDRALAPGGVVGLSTSLGGDSGWELVPAGPARVPALVADQQRWFVHHRQQHIETAVSEAGWRIEHESLRSSHRQWLQVVAAKPA